MSEKNGLVKNASFLMMATLISRVIGLLYRSPLGVVLGTVGLGYYGYANNVYVILLLISAYSIPMAVGRIGTSGTETISKCPESLSWGVIICNDRGWSGSSGCLFLW